MKTYVNVSVGTIHCSLFIPMLSDNCITNETDQSYVVKATSAFKSLYEHI